MSQINTLGPVGFNPKGEYNSETEYNKLDVVLYQGSSYIAKQTVLGIVPTNSTYWTKLIAGGVGVDDIVDNLESADSEKPLSAKQGKVLNEKFKQYFKVTTSMTHQQVQDIFDTVGYKIVEFEKGDYTFNAQFKLNANTKIILNNSTLTFTQRFAFWNFNPTDEFLEYNGNGNIEIVGGTIIGGTIRFCHAKNITFKNLNFAQPLADHLLEMAAINGLLVCNCKFDGQTTNKTYTETIQIDDMTRANFPWFDDEDNPTYDNTPNTNWEIMHCKFFNSNSNNYAFHTAIGNHTYVEGYIHTNIYIHHNEFDGFDFAGIRLKNNKNTTIENNVFKCGISETVEIPVIHVENVSENLKICNNTIDGNINGTSRFLVVGTNAVNLEVINNVVKNFKTQSAFSSSSTNIIMRIWDSDVKIKNNLFENFDKNLLYILDDTNDSNLIFENNIVRNTTTDTNLMRCYSKCDIVCNNNTFDIENVAYVLRIGANVKSISFKNNSLNNYLKTKAIDLGSYTGSLANVYDIMFSGWVENVSSLTSQALNKPYSDFDTAFLDCGINGENLTQFRLQKYGRDGKLTKATYKLLATDKDDNIKVITFSFNENGTISYSSTNSGINFRSIKFTNSGSL